MLNVFSTENHPIHYEYFITYRFKRSVWLGEAPVNFLWNKELYLAVSISTDIF